MRIEASRSWTCWHRRQRVVILGADLDEDLPIGVAQVVDEEHARRRAGLANRFGLPVLAELDHEEVVAQLSFGERDRIGAEMLVDQPQLAVIGVPGAIGIVTQRQQLGEAGHRFVGVLVIDGIINLALAEANLREVEVRVGVRWDCRFLILHPSEA
jgi:hypothetical protein